MWLEDDEDCYLEVGGVEEDSNWSNICLPLAKPFFDEWLGDIDGNWETHSSKNRLGSFLVTVFFLVVVNFSSQINLSVLI